MWVALGSSVRITDGGPKMLQVDRDRIKSAAGVALLHGLVGYALLTALGAKAVSQAVERLKMFDVADVVPPPPLVEPPPDTEDNKVAKTKDAEGAASPANLKDTPSPVVVPEPKIKIPVPPPIVAAPVGGQGNAAAAGAARVPGPGTGSGGVGTGLGSGLHGNGTGGGGGGRAIPARWISGGIYTSDDPRPLNTPYSDVVEFDHTIAANGRVISCRVTRSSGDRALDAHTCRLVMQRIRYSPARDAAGRAIQVVARGGHVWEPGLPPGH